MEYVRKMVDFVPTERGTPIRPPATANLMIDSADRNIQANAPYYSALFTITKQQSILNGFFTRIGTTEVVLEWNTPNVSAQVGNNVLTIDLSGATGGGGTASQTYTIPPTFFTVEQAYNYLTEKLNALGATLTPAITFTSNPVGGEMGCTITPSAAVYYGASGSFATALQADAALFLIDATTPLVFVEQVDLRPYRYLDFVSAQLTYNQDVKDSSTALYIRDVLCRWYFAYDNPPALDGFGFPILMGYSPFVLRRLYNPPKQIKWDPAQVIGQLTFEVYTNTGNLLQPGAETQWLMTLQISET